MAELIALPGSSLFTLAKGAHRGIEKHSLKLVILSGDKVNAHHAIMQPFSYLGQVKSGRSEALSVDNLSPAGLKFLVSVFLLSQATHTGGLKACCPSSLWPMTKVTRTGTSIMMILLAIHGVTVHNFCLL